LALTVALAMITTSSSRAGNVVTDNVVTDNVVIIIMSMTEIMADGLDKR
jgi:hypothetical protein